MSRDYFQALGLEPKLSLDPAVLQKRFYARSRELHPDRFMLKPAPEREAAEQASALLNDAYRTLRDRVRRAQYLLSLEGYKEAEKKAPPDLLEEIFDLNMEIEEMRMAKKAGDEAEMAQARKQLEVALADLNKKMEELEGQLLALFDRWDESVDSAVIAERKKTVLDRMSQLLSHRSYIRNLVRDIKEEIL